MKSIRLIHKWNGLAISLFLFISCFSGVFIIIGRLAGSYAPFFRWMKILHRTLFLDETGSLIIGIATLLLVMEIITGSCLWGKIAGGRIRASVSRGATSWAGFRQSLSWTFPNKHLGFHIAAGFWSVIPLLLMALTGLTWSFGWYSKMIFGLFDPEGTGNLFHTIVTLHVGSFWGTWSSVLWLVMAVLGCSLPVTGLMIFCRHPHRKKIGRN